MSNISLDIKSKSSLKSRTLIVKMDADRLERLAANFGLLSPDFLQSIARAEQDYKSSRVKKIRSLKELIP